MILYNGQRRTTGADFISLGLVGGRLEFRSVCTDLKRSPNWLKPSVLTLLIIILMMSQVWRGLRHGHHTWPQPCQTGRVSHSWAVSQPHIGLHHCRRRGAHQRQLTGTYVTPTVTYVHLIYLSLLICSISCPQGKFQGLDLNEELHVGGYPNYTVLAKTAGIKTGFVGKTSLCLHHGRKYWMEKKKSSWLEDLFDIASLQAVSVSWSSKVMRSSSKTLTAALLVSQTAPPAKTTHARSVIHLIYLVCV